MHSNTKKVDIFRVIEQQGSPFADKLAVEEPLEIKLGFGKGKERQQKSLAVTMRTPGHDFDLAMGFLFSEGIIGSAADVLSVRYLARQLEPESQENVVQIDIQPALPVDFDKLSRHFYTSSSCGICGKASIDMVRTTSCYFPRPGYPKLDASLLYQLPEKLLEAQAVFETTGGIHAAGLFDAEGKTVLMREDVGRHNALDKLLGATLQKQMIPLTDYLILLSGRVSFELVQKALMAGIPIVAAVGAPSSLAIELAEEYGMTIIGFLREEKFNVYCGKERVAAC